MEVFEYLVLLVFLNSAELRDKYRMLGQCGKSRNGRAYRTADIPFHTYVVAGKMPFPTIKGHQGLSV